MSVATGAPAGRSRIPPAQWAAVGGGAAIAVGAAATVDATPAAAVAVLVLIAAATAVRPSTIVMLLVASIFLEVIALGGVTISRLAAPLALLVVIIQWLRRRASMQFAVPLVGVIAYSLWAVASLLWTVDGALTLTLLASLAIAITYSLAVAMLIRDERELRSVLIVLAVASVTVGLMTLAAFSGHGGSSDSLQSGRAQGGVGDPNFFANVQLVSLPLILALGSEIRGHWQRLALYGGALVVLASILSTLSRGGMISLLVILLALPFVPSRSMLGSRSQKGIVIGLLVIGLIALFSRPGFSAEVVGRAKTIFSGGQETGSSAGSGRSEIWKAARHSIRDTPLTGVGFGAFPTVSTRYLLTTPGVDVTNFSPRPIQAHSAYFGSAAEVGYIGLALFLGMLLATAISLRRTAVRAFRVGTPFAGRVANACILSLTAWSISSFFIETETARALWIIIGMALLLHKLVPSSERTRPSYRWRW